MRLPLACSLAALLTSALPGFAQVTPQDARKLQMETAWQSQVQLPIVGRGLISSHLWVEPTQPRRFAVVELSDRIIRVSADMLDRRGAEIGIEEAKKRAGEQAARLLGKNEGFQVVDVSIPRIKLVLVSSDGLVQVLDAESGKLLWATPCGPSTAPAHPAAVSPMGIVLIQGDRLYLLDWESGKQLMNQPLRFASANAVAACNDIVFVSDFTGRVEAYGLGEPRNPWGYRINGRAVGKSVSLADQSVCAIASTDGYVYMFVGGENPNVWTRYETASAINGSLAAGNGAFYAGTAAGLMTKISVQDRLGRLNWEFRTGHTITTPALVIGGQVVVATETGEVYSIDDETGLVQWATNSLGLNQPIARSAGHIFCTSLLGEVYALNAETGSIVGKTIPMKLSKPIVNQVSDRLYVVDAHGRLQCLRPQGGVLPEMIIPVIASEAEPTPAPTTERPEATPATENPFNFGTPPSATPGTDPFNTDSPFGSEATPATDSGTANPFGAPAAGDPFGGPGAGADPFGSTSDPFEPGAN